MSEYRLAISARAILASAGSGKTFQLSNEYLRLLVRGVPVERVLATTFTRKAAGEILERVLGRLADAAQSEAAARALGEYVGDTRLSASQCEDVLATFVRTLHRARIGTIDAFFAGLASVFAMDMDLPLGWAVASDDEQRALELHAVEAAIEQADTGEMVQLLRSLHQGGYPSQVGDAVLRVVRQAHGVARKSSPQAWRMVPASTRPDPSLSTDMPELMRQLSRMAAIPEGGAKVNGHLANARDSFVCAATDGDYAKAAASLLARAAALPGGAYRGAVLPTPMAEAIVRIARWCAALALLEVREANIAMRALADRYALALARLKGERGRLEFDDVPRELLRANATGHLDDLYYRLDSRLDHVLLDEFQDTSIEQFTLLRPLIDEILSGGEGASDHREATAHIGRSVFLVGDVKQSMYAWRNAEPELFGGVLRQWPQLQRDNLHQSRRSSQIVLDAVNAVFSNLAANEAFAKPGDRASAGAWSAEFVPHTAAKDLPGGVRLHIAPEPGESESGALVRMRAAADRIRALSASAPRATIGVLLPARKHIARLIYELKERGVPASEEGGNPLTDSPAVAAVLSALQIVDHPDDRAARFHVSTTPLGDYFELREWRSDRRAIEFSARTRRALGERGLASVLRGWRGSLAARCTARDMDRLAQLVELGEEHEPAGATRLREFIELVSARRVESAGIERVRVMTIHKSKGLEFDAVVLPELDVAMLRHDGLVTRRASVFGPIEAVSRFPSESVRALSPELDSMHDETRSRDLRERLCVLYVAMTRARHALEMFVDAKGGRQSPSYSQIVRGALGIARDAGGGHVAYMRGGDNWTDGFKDFADVPLPSVPIRIRARVSEVIPTRRLPVLAPSALHSSVSHGPSDASANLSSSDVCSTRLGTLLHAALERIEWMEDSMPPIHQLLSSLEFTNDTESRTVALVLGTALSRASSRGVLSRVRYAEWRADRLLVFREARLGARVTGCSTGRESLLVGFADRIVVGLREGRALAAEVIDYKSDLIDPSEAHERRVAYEPQVNAYREIVSKQFGLPLNRVRGTLFFLRPGEVCSWAGEPDVRP